MTNPTTPDTGTELVTYGDEIGMDRLTRAPIIDRIDPRQLDLIRSTIGVSEDPKNQPITNAELGLFLELCAHYDFEWAAHEAWIAKSKTGKLLIMVGRAGLRKVADRNGLRVRTDVICTKDDFASTFIDSPHEAKEGEWEAHGRQPFHRIAHTKRGITSEARGAVAGAWSRVTRRDNNVEVGYFDAPITEYKPSNASVYSPWSKQESAMMQGAVERQAIAQATPLGGLYAQGEDESANTAQTVLGAGQGSGEGPGWGDMPLDQVRLVMNVIERAQQLGHAGLSAVETIQQRLNGQTPEVVAMWIRDSTDTLDGMANPEPEIPEADVVEERPLADRMADSAKADEAARARFAARHGRPPNSPPIILTVAPADEFTLSFGGETFTFSDPDDPYGMIAEAMKDGPDAMEDVALSLGAVAGDFEDEPIVANGYRQMAAALHREAQERSGQTEMDV